MSDFAVKRVYKDHPLQCYKWSIQVGGLPLQVHEVKIACFSLYHDTCMGDFGHQEL